MSRACKRCGLWRAAFCYVLSCCCLLSAAPKRAVLVPLAWPRSGAVQSVRYERSLSTPAELGIRKGFFKKLADIVFGPSAKPQGLLRPSALTADGRGRVFIADRGARAVHIIDPRRKKHKRLEGAKKQRFLSPAGLAVDSSGRIYVSDSARGKIYVFDSRGRFERFLGDAKGEGIFKRPTGLAVDSSSGRIYLTDTLRHAVHVLDERGHMLDEWGRRGDGPGEFNFPVDVAVASGRVFVLDAMNFRVQVFRLDGTYLTSFGKPVNEPGGLLRPKALAVDQSAELVWVVDAYFEVVQAFDFNGNLVMAFGYGGAAPGRFRLPSGICLDADGRLLIADSFNSRVQVFRPRLEKTRARGKRE